MAFEDIKAKSLACSYISNVAYATSGSATSLDYKSTGPNCV